MPTEKHRRNSGRMERVISRRRIPLNDHGVAALQLFLQHDLFDRLADRSRVPDEGMVPWYNELYYQLKVAVRDMDHYQALLLNKLASITGVTGVHSSFVLRRVVDKTALPV